MKSHTLKFFKQWGYFPYIFIHFISILGSLWWVISHILSFHWECGGRCRHTIILIKQSFHAKDCDHYICSRDGGRALVPKWMRSSGILEIQAALLMYSPSLLSLPWDFSHCPFNQEPYSLFQDFLGSWAGAPCAWNLAPSHLVKLSPAIIQPAPEIPLPAQSPPQLRAKWFSSSFPPVLSRRLPLSSFHCLYRMAGAQWRPGHDTEAASCMPFFMPGTMAEAQVYKCALLGSARREAVSDCSRSPGITLPGSKFPGSVN